MSIMTDHPQKITFAEMREMGVRASTLALDARFTSP